MTPEAREKAIAGIIYKLPALPGDVLARLAREVEQLPERALDGATLAAEQYARGARDTLTPEDDRG